MLGNFRSDNPKRHFLYFMSFMYLCAIWVCPYVYETGNEDDSLFMIFVKADADSFDCTMQCI